MAVAAAYGDLPLVKWLLEASGFDGDAAMIRRIVLDVNIEEPVTLYVECYGDHDTLSVVPPDVRGTTINLKTSSTKRP